MVRLWWGSGQEAGESSNTPRSNQTRDRDLIHTDELLTDDALDDLWTWFCDASKAGNDPQLVFVKMINSARKPYVDRLEQLGFTNSTTFVTPTSSTRSASDYFMRSSTTGSTCYTPSECTARDNDNQSQLTHSTNPATPTGSTSAGDTFWFWRQRSSSTASSKCYTSSERTVMTDHDNQSYYKEDSVHEQSQQLKTAQATISKLQNEKQQLDAMVKSLTDRVSALPPAPPAWPLRVVIKSVHFRNRYVRMDGTGILSPTHSGGGHVNVQTFIGGWETFELVRHPENNVVSFKGLYFDNVYIRADARGLGRGHAPGYGGGLINCQYGCGDFEKFRLLSVGNQGEVAIEPLKFPGRFFRLDGNWLHGVNLQGQVSAWEKFYLVIVP